MPILSFFQIFFVCIKKTNTLSSPQSKSSSLPSQMYLLSWSWQVHFLSLFLYFYCFIYFNKHIYIPYSYLLLHYISPPNSLAQSNNNNCMIISDGSVNWLESAGRFSHEAAVRWGLGLESRWRLPHSTDLVADAGSWLRPQPGPSAGTPTCGLFVWPGLLSQHGGWISRGAGRSCNTSYDLCLEAHGIICTIVIGPSRFKKREHRPSHFLIGRM